MSNITASVEKNVVITLKFTEKSAKILMSMVQNPHMDDEPEEVANFRNNLWKALLDQGFSLK